MTASEWRSVGPSGQPATARMWFSNWLDGAGVDGPVAGVVHARRDLVDHERLGRLLADVEHLHRQHADVVERLGDRGGDLAGARQRRPAAGGDGTARGVENAALMRVDRQS